LLFAAYRREKVAVLSNQTGIVGNEHLVDVLVRNGINIVGIFSPEHGFRGNADAGEHVNNSIDEKPEFQSGRFTEMRAESLRPSK